MADLWSKILLSNFEIPSLMSSSGLQHYALKDSRMLWVDSPILKHTIVTLHILLFQLDHSFIIWDQTVMANYVLSSIDAVDIDILFFCLSNNIFPFRQALGRHSELQCLLKLEK